MMKSVLVFFAVVLATTLWVVVCRRTMSMHTCGSTWPPIEDRRIPRGARL
jgi:hypothetical protein